MKARSIVYKRPEVPPPLSTEPLSFETCIALGFVHVRSSSEPHSVAHPALGQAYFEPPSFAEIIDQIKRAEYERGRADKAQELRIALGLFR